MKIHELGEQTGLTAPTIRFYEREGLLDHRHVRREDNNYRSYSVEAVERLKLIRKLQGVGFTLAEMKETLQEEDAQSLGNRRVIERIRAKITEIEGRKDEYEQILGTLRWMLEYRIALTDDPQRARSMFELRHTGKA